MARKPVPAGGSAPAETATAAPTEAARVTPPETATGEEEEAETAADPDPAPGDQAHAPAAADPIVDPHAPATLTETATAAPTEDMVLVRQVSISASPDGVHLPGDPPRYITIDDPMLADSYVELV